MREHRYSVVTAVLILALTLFCPVRSWSQVLLHGIPSFDSGWVDLPQSGQVVVQHGVGGNIDHYVVDLQARDLVDGHGGGHRVHQRGFGGDDNEALYWQQLTDSLVTVYGDGDQVQQVRVRIWEVTDAAFDSGWQVFDETLKVLQHHVGGALDNYVVDLQFFDADFRGIHNYGYGRSQLPIPAINSWGGAWLGLDISQVQIMRPELDGQVDSVRLRIFLRPEPAYDSGWDTIATGTTRFLTHGLGGPWNDFVVDLQFRDTNNNLGTNQIGYGGDVLDDGTRAILASYGAYWSHLTGRSISVRRYSDDEAADEVRVRIWQSRRPKADTGWVALSAGMNWQFNHGLGGDPDTYVVDLQFKDTGAVALFGTNQNSYGGNLVYDNPLSNNYGAYWAGLDSSSVIIGRDADDAGADLVRARLWIAPEAELDLGWYDTLGLSGDFEFDVSAAAGYPSSWVLDLQASDAGLSSWGVNHLGYGIDNINPAAGGYSGVGLAWKKLSNTSVTVESRAWSSNRHFRLRIWHNQAFDWIDTWQPISTILSRNHGLSVNADELVVDLHFKDVDIEEIHNLYYGGDRSDMAVGDRQGASWFGLLKNVVSVLREAEDQLVDSVRLRLWRGVDAEIFRDGFETNSTNRWSVVLP